MPFTVIDPSNQTFGCVSEDPDVNSRNIATLEQLSRAVRVFNMTVSSGCTQALETFSNHMELCFKQITAYYTVPVTSSKGVLSSNATREMAKRFEAELCHIADKDEQEQWKWMGVGLAALISLILLTVLIYNLINAFTNRGCTLFARDRERPDDAIRLVDNPRNLAPH